MFCLSLSLSQYICVGKHTPFRIIFCYDLKYRLTPDGYSLSQCFLGGQGLANILTFMTFKHCKKYFVVLCTGIHAYITLLSKEEEVMECKV